MNIYLGRGDGFDLRHRHPEGRRDGRRGAGRLQGGEASGKHLGFGGAELRSRLGRGERGVSW